MAAFTLILPAAGRSSRFGGQRNKLYETLGGELVIVRTLRAFLCRADVAGVMIATMDRPGLEELLRSAMPNGRLDPRINFCQGGQSRAHSVRNAVEAADPAVEWVAVHDAARPLVSQAIIDRTFATARQHGAAVPALPVHLTIKQAEGPLPARVQRTVPRQSLWAMQTPQIMRRESLLRAFRTCPIPLDQITDDAQALELIGEPVWLVDGEQQNLKITTPADMTLAEIFLREH